MGRTALWLFVSPWVLNYSQVPLAGEEGSEWKNLGTATNEVRLWWAIPGLFK